MGVRVLQNQISLSIQLRVMIGNISVHTNNYCLTTKWKMSDSARSCTEVRNIFMATQKIFKTERNEENSGSQKQWTLDHENSKK